MEKKECKTQSIWWSFPHQLFNILKQTSKGQNAYDFDLALFNSTYAQAHLRTFHPGNSHCIIRKVQYG